MGHQAVVIERPFFKVYHEKESLCIQKVFIVLQGKKTAVIHLVDAQPFQLLEVFSGWLTIAFISKAFKCFSGST